MKKKYNNSPFYYEVAFLFLPRCYEAGATLFEKGDEFHEILLQTDGEIEGILESSPPINRFYHKGYFLGDYEVLFNRRSIMTYKTTTSVKFLALPKHRFLKILSKYPEISQAIKANSSELYHQQKRRFVGPPDPDCQAQASHTAAERSEPRARQARRCQRRRNHKTPRKSDLPRPLQNPANRKRHASPRQGPAKDLQF